MAWKSLNSILAAAGVVVGPAVHAGLAEVQEFSEMEEWVAAIGGEDAFTTIDFTGFPDGTVITEQYADLGVHFTDGDDQIENLPHIYINDGSGLDANVSSTIVFDTPQQWVSAAFPGVLSFELYLDGVLIYDSGLLGIGGPGQYGGLISDTPFDMVIIDDQGPHVDDIYFGGAIPAPPVLAVFGLFVLARNRRSRRSC